MARRIHSARNRSKKDNFLSNDSPTVFPGAGAGAGGRVWSMLVAIEGGGLPVSSGEIVECKCISTRRYFFPLCP